MAVVGEHGIVPLYLQLSELVEFAADVAGAGQGAGGGARGGRGRPHITLFLVQVQRRWISD